MQLIVMGMHRAGTSVLARLLNMMGAYYGPEGIHFGASAENAKGFWERKDILKLHQDIFSSQNIDWDKPTALDIESLLNDDKHSLAIKNLLLELEAHRPWMLKDPRMCLLFPLWKPLLEMPVCIHINRPPIQVAQSLQQRSGMPLHVGVALWEYYNLKAFSASADVPRVLIQHQELMTQPTQVIIKLHQQLSELNVQGLRLPSAQEIEAFIDTSLFRQKGSAALQQAYCNAPQQKLQALIETGKILKLSADKLPKLSQGAATILEQYQQKWQAEQDHIALQEEMQNLRETARQHYQSYIKEHQTLEQQADYFQSEITQLKQKSQRQADTYQAKLQQQADIYQAESQQQVASHQTEIEKLQQQNLRQQNSISHQQQQQRQLKTDIQQLHNSQQHNNQQQQQEQQQNQNWFHSLDNDIQAIFASLTWKIGNGIVSLIRKILFINNPTAADHIQKTLAEIQQHGLEKKKSIAKDSAPNLPLYQRLGRLANWNNLKLFWTALKNIRQIGVQSFVERSIEYVQGNENPIPATPALASILAQHQPSDLVKQLDCRIDIIVPIYNGLNHLKNLIPNVLENTQGDYQLILFDDASPDLAVKSYLEQMAAEYAQITLIRGDKNQGFIGAVNGAYKHVKNHFVILNQDTQVPPNWLPRLMQPILTQADKIACTTPFTNAGTICSFPTFLEDNPLYRDLNVEELDKVFQAIPLPQPVIEMPTGIGFCMGMNKQLSDQIGLFNQDLFGRGYAEENDWCQRAILAGYQNIPVPNLFVYHAHGGVFTSEEKAHLIKTNLATLNQQHPTYSQQVQTYIKADPLKTAREYALIQIGTQQAPKVHLYLDHGLGGGANIYTEQKIKHWLQQGDAIFKINYDFKHALYQCEYQDIEQKLNFQSQQLSDIERLYKIFPISHLHISNLVSFPKIPALCQTLNRWQQQYDLKLAVYIHDYYAVCPSYTLLNQHGDYCQVPNDLNTCQNCLKQHDGEFNMFIEQADKDIHRWRKAWGELLESAQNIYCFSQASAEIINRAYPQASQQITVKPHQVNDVEKLNPATAHQGFNIGILGAINQQKGLDIIKAMLAQIEQQGLDIRIIVIGYLAENISHPQLHITGRYQRQELSKLIQQQQIDLFFIPSIWPETFSYTSEEVMQMGYPLAVFPLGAPAERVKDYEKGLIIDSMDADKIVKQIQSYLAID